MKKFFLPLCALILGLSSCSEDFEVAAPYKAITVVYGMLDVRDTAHYIRIQKAFLDESKSAIDMSATADSSFYRAIRVQLREISGSTVVNLPDLERVDLTTQGFPKDTGAFFTSPSYAYKTKVVLNPNSRYRLVITNTETGQVDSSETAVLNPDQSAFEVFQLDIFPDFRIDFSSTTPGSTFRLQINKLPPAAYILEGVMRFHVIDRNTVTGAEIRRTHDFAFQRIDAGNANFPRFEIPTASFYPFLQSAIGPAPAQTERLLDSPDVFIYASTQDFAEYLKFSEASGGITGDQVKPGYTNIRSTAGTSLGLFSSRTARIRYSVPLRPLVIDSLKSNPQTANLNITGIYQK